MCAYLSKSEDECSQAMSEAMKDAFEKKLKSYDWIIMNKWNLLLTLTKKTRM